MKRLWLTGVFGVLLSIFTLLSGTGSAFAQTAAPRAMDTVHARHVLLLSIDGFHALDLALYVRLYPGSALASLAGMGVTYTNASTSRPSDSFPGLLSMVTGGSPRSTGV